MNISWIPTILVLTSTIPGLTQAGSWPTYMHDAGRSGVTTEALSLPLKEAWVFEASQPPQPAWPAPAGQDYFHRHYNLRSTVTYDRAFHIVGGRGRLFFGSSAQDKICCLNARTGKLVWTFVTEGPVRFAPTVAGRRLYAGSDDGCVYCLSARDGSLIWKRRIAPDDRRIPGNGRIISLWPIRTGLIVDDGTVYCTAGLFPLQGVYLAALDAENGSVRYRHKVNVSAQGYMLASADRLYIPTGRTSPVIFTRPQGGFQGELPSAGGAYALLSEDVLLTGPGRGTKAVTASDIRNKDAIATFAGLRLLVPQGRVPQGRVAGGVAYMQSETEITALDRTRYLQLSRERNGLRRRQKELEKQLKPLKDDSDKARQLQKQIHELRTQIAQRTQQMKQCVRWKSPCPHHDAMILAADTLFVGGRNEVAAIGTQDGSGLWRASVRGNACGLSVIEAALIVSTDSGHIHCFRNKASGPVRRIHAKTDRQPYPRDKLTALYNEAADLLASQVTGSKGYCLVLDCDRGRLAYELARRTDLKIIGVEPDAAKAAAARKAIDRAGLGGRVSIHHVTGPNLPYTSYFANLITSDAALRTGRTAVEPTEALRLLRPCGGVLAVGWAPDRVNEPALKTWGQATIGNWRNHRADTVQWKLAIRPALAGAGQWTHTYAEPGNSACSADTLVNGPMTLQWFGEPGPRRMIDRHHRNIPPLFKDGRLFVPGDCIVYAVDAYNGAIQWEIEIPNSRRLGVFLDSSNMAVDENFLYVAAEDRLHRIDTRTGRQEPAYKIPQVLAEPCQWGYLAYAGGILLGTGCSKGASYTETSYDADVALWYRDMKLVTSQYLFAISKKTGRKLWTHRDDLIINTTIAVGPGRVYFVETSSPKALAGGAGRMPVKVLFDGGRQHLVALEMTSGKVVFKKPISVTHFAEPVYLNYAGGKLILSGSRLIEGSVRYHYDVFDAETGELAWQRTHDTGLATDGGHGEYNRHPTIIGQVVYAWPHAYKLGTGEPVEGWKFDRRGHGCGGISASAQSLFWRGANPWMYDLGPDGGPARLNAVSRPGCWVNIIPAGGLVLVPEASSGCTCGFPLQTSMAFIPREHLN